MPRQTKDRAPVVGDRVLWNCHGALKPGLHGTVLAVGDTCMDVLFDAAGGVPSRHLPIRVLDEWRWWFEDERALLESLP